MNGGATCASLKATAVAVCAVLGLAAAALWSGTFRLQAWTAEQARRLRVQQHPPRLAPLRVITATGARQLLWGAGDGGTGGGGPRIWLVTFMYTRCLTYCSVLGTQFERLQRELRTDPRDAGIGLLSLSFDPTHDDLRALRQYALEHHADPARWTIAVPADPPDLPRLERQAGVVVIADGAGGWLHNAAIHVVQADGRLVRILDFGRPEAALAWARTHQG